MLQQTISNFLSAEGIPTRSSFLLAVSGGPDSMAMLHAFSGLGLDIRAAHCNFSLRGAESDMDEAFVVRFCEEHDIPCSLVRFDTRHFAEEKGLSIEMAARELRYTWFRRIREQYGLDYTVVAHHADDLAETCLINLCRGTGIKGLGGMRPVNGDVLRPLLACSREDIIRYLEKRGVDYRTDSTNASLDFVRNRIRHRIIPECKTINPSFLNTMRSNCSTMRETEAIYRYGLALLQQDIVEYRKGETVVDIAKTTACPAPFTFLYETLSPYGFNKTQIREILASADRIAGKRFMSGSHILTRDRSSWRICPKTETVEEDRMIDGCGEFVADGHSYILSILPATANFKIPKDPSIACLDADKAVFPLELRGWRPGDSFCPFGMKGRRKKLSDFFADRKFSLIEKGKCRLICSGGEIAWICGVRTDERFKVSSDTVRILLISPKEKLR